MELYLLLHSAVMHVTAALVILVYIPLSVPVKLFVRAFVKPLRKEDLRGKVVLITGASSGIGEVSRLTQPSSVILAFGLLLCESQLLLSIDCELHATATASLGQ